jgi:hypothetical protein
MLLSILTQKRCLTLGSNIDIVPHFKFPGSMGISPDFVTSGILVTCCVLMNGFRFLTFTQLFCASAHAGLLAAACRRRSQEIGNG